MYDQAKENVPAPYSLGYPVFCYRCGEKILFNFRTASYDPKTGQEKPELVGQCPNYKQDKVTMLGNGHSFQTNLLQ